MKEIGFNSAGKSIRLSIEDYFNLDESLMKQYIPSLNVSNKIERVNYTIQVIKGDSSFNFNEERAVYVTQGINNNDVMALLSRYFEYLFFKEGKYSVHSSAFCHNNEAVVIAGRSGSGKTTLLLKLLEKNSELGLISSDRTLISNSYVIGGTKIINIKGSSLLYEFPDIWKRMALGERVEAQEQFRLIEENSPFKYHTDPVLIRCIIYPYKTNGELETKKLQYPNNLTRFANQAFYFLEEFPRILIDGKIVLSTPIKDSDKNLTLKQIDLLVSNVDSYTLSGKLEDMQEWITKENCMDYYKKGIVHSQSSWPCGSNTLTDSCVSSSVVREYYLDCTLCDSIKSTDTACPANYECSDGKCVISQCNANNCGVCTSSNCKLC